MKVSLRFGPSGGGDADHNCRNYDTTKSPHIMQEKIKDNVSMCVYPELIDDFTAAEKKFYEDNFQHLLDRQNANALKHRRKDRVKTMDEFRESRNNAVTESLFQIGNIYNQPDKQVLAKAYNELMKYSDEITGGRCKVLNASLHVDESTPHVHTRMIWVYNSYDEQGNPQLEIGKAKALEQAGIPLPYADEPEDSRRNNRMMTYTDMMREKAYDLCREYGLEMDESPRERGEGYTKTDYLDFIMESREAALDLKRQQKQLEKERAELRENFPRFYGDKKPTREQERLLKIDEE